YARAAQVLGMTAESPGASADVYYAYGLALAKSGEREKAVAAYQTALQRGLGGLSRYIALWQTIWLRDWGRYLIIGIALAAFLAWLLLAKPSAQTLTLFAVLVVILFLQRFLGGRGR
ncbi:MAG: tetratricopeptide repeat protein, partial [Chloroflexi bacterium]|nr:tetratricopeptide repeat protein [Chloroflexota bacterium]